MRKTLAVVVSLTAAAPLAAQAGPPSPAPELKRLDRLTGAFTGQGIVRMAAGAEPVAWTSHSTGQWTLGGHALEEQMSVTFEGGAIPPIRFRAFFGWDRETNRC